MATTPFPKPILPYPMVVPQTIGPPLSTGRTDLTIRRITKTHHGRTLQMLGHAAEYLIHSRGFLEQPWSAADDEAVRILMRLSSAIFRDYAEAVRVRRPVEDFVMGCANRLLE